MNNTVIFQLRMLPKVANERYCNIFLIFGVVWAKGVATQGVHKKSFCTTKIIFFPVGNYFFLWRDFEIIPVVYVSPRELKLIPVEIVYVSTGFEILSHDNNF